MITIECPWCDGVAGSDESLAIVACDDCGVSVAVAPDTTPAHELDQAA